METIDFEKIQAVRDAQRLEAEKTELQKAAVENAEKVAKQVQQGTVFTHRALSDVEKSVATLSDKIDDFTLTTFISHNGTLKEITDALKKLSVVLDSASGIWAKNQKELSKDFAKTMASTLPKPPKPLEQVGIKNLKDLAPFFTELSEKIETSLKKLEVNPRVEVKPPVVNVESVNLDPIKKAIEKTIPKEIKPQFDLSTYHAQDLDEMEPGIQYVGFTNLDGYWYVLKNDLKENTMRYKFGKDDYSTAWGLASTFKYELLEVAINAIKA